MKDPILIKFNRKVRICIFSLEGGSGINILLFYKFLVEPYMRKHKVVNFKLAFPFLYL